MHYKEVKAILSPQNGMNLYRGCTHGCIYCDSRSKCYRMDCDFEDIEVKLKADELLEHTLKRKRTKGMIMTGMFTDPYIPLEEELKLTRRCLYQIERFDFGLTIQTKSDLILRDIDILDKINKKTKCVVCVPISTFDDELCKRLEPNTVSTKRRFEVIMEFKKRDIPVIVMLGPVLPFINDGLDNIEGIMKCCIDEGVYGIMDNGMSLTLRSGSREYFYDKLDLLFDGMKERYIEAYGDAGELISPNREKLVRYFRNACEEGGIVYDREELTRYMREYKNKTVGTQMTIFDYV